MPSGGKREGAGRKPGSTTRIAREARARAQATGQLPHEFLLSVTRGETIGEKSPSLDQRIDAAKASAPFYAPKLATTEVRVSGNPLKELMDHLNANGKRGLI